MNELASVKGYEVEEQKQALSADLQNLFYEYIQAKPATKETYMKAVKQFYIFLEETGTLRPDMKTILDFVEYLQKEQRDINGEVIRKASKPATVNLYLTAVKLFFQWLEDNGIYSNVARRVKRIKVDNNYHKRDYLTAEQSRDVLENIDRDSLKGLRDYAIISLMLTTGVRDLEVMNANVEDFRTVRGYMALFVKGKGYNEGNVEFVKIGRKTEKAIREYMSARNAKDGEPLFASVSNRDAGQRMTTRSISRIAKNSMIGAGYNSDRLTAHSMRHTAATLNMNNGGSLQETQQLLRHSNINTTMIYSHDITRDNNNSAYRVEAAILGA